MAAVNPFLSSVSLQALTSAFGASPVLFQQPIVVSEFSAMGMTIYEVLA